MAVSLLAHHGPDALGEVLTISGWGLVPAWSGSAACTSRRTWPGWCSGSRASSSGGADAGRSPGRGFRRVRGHDDPLTALLVLLPTEAVEPASRLAEMEALLEQGRRCGVAVVLVGTAPPAGSYREVVVAADGSLATAGAALMGGAGRLYTRAPPRRRSWRPLWLGVRVTSRTSSSSLPPRRTPGAEALSRPRSPRPLCGRARSSSCRVEAGSVFDLRGCASSWAERRSSGHRGFWQGGPQPAGGGEERRAHQGAGHRPHQRRGRQRLRLRTYWDNGIRKTRRQCGC